MNCTTCKNPLNRVLMSVVEEGERSWCGQYCKEVFDKWMERQGEMPLYTFYLRYKHRSAVALKK